MIPGARRASFAFATSILVACGGRAALDGGDTLDACPAPTTTGDASPPPDVAADAAAPDADAGPPAAPCHLVRRDDPLPTISFPDQPRWTFHQDGMLLRRAAPGAPPRVVQYGSVEGAGTDGWSDPAFYAAEYDVSTWPPRELHPPTRISDATEGEGSAVELPDGRLFFSWVLQVDNGGLGPTDVLYRALDGASWNGGPQGTLVKHAALPTAPVLAPDGSGLSLVYQDEDTGDAGPDPLPPLLRLDGRFASFALDGTPADVPATLWSAADEERAPFWYQDRQTFARTRTDLLAVVAFDDCGPKLSSAFCEPKSMVVLRVEPAHGAAATVVKAATVPMRNADDVATMPQLVTDGEGENWLTWWEAPASDAGVVFAQNLYALPLTDRGEPAGPIESWLASDHVDGLITDWDRAPTTGPLGVVYPVSVDAPAPDGGSGGRQVHLVHRPRGGAPVEDLTFTTPYSAYAVVAVEIEEPRAVVVGYSTYPDEGGAGFAELARYTCAEDGD